MTAEKVNMGTAVALGNFDGLHKGHMAVLKKALEFKQCGYVPTVVLFNAHPKEVLTGEKVRRLLTAKQTEKLLENMGFKICIISFEDVKDFSSERFFKEILINKLNAKAVCCGFNYTFGKNGAADSNRLSALAAENGIECCVVPAQNENGEPISSTAVKKYLLDGEPHKAAGMLGRNYAFSSEVIHGDQRGRTLGFPTANQKIDENLIVPKYGVYETVAIVDGKKYRGVTNIGIRPTYILDTALSETFIIDFSGDIYGKTITVEILRYLREERNFSSAEELVKQLDEDVKQVSKDE